MSRDSHDNLQSLSSVDPSPIEEVNERTALFPRPSAYSDSDDDSLDSLDNGNGTWTKRTRRLFANGSVIAITLVAIFWWIMTMVNLLISFSFVDSVRESGFLNVDLIFIGLLSIMIYGYYGLDPYSGTHGINNQDEGATPEQKITWLTVALLALDLVIIISVPGLRRRYQGQFYWLPLIMPFVLSSVLLLLSLRRNRRRRISRVTWFTNVVISGLIRILILLLILAVTVNTVREAILTKGSIKPFDFGGYYSSVNQDQDYEYFVPVDDATYNLYIKCTAPRPLKTKSKVAEQKNLTILVDSGTLPGSDIYSWLKESDLSSLESGETASYSRTCYYDHPGIGKSDNSPSPISAGGIADGLTQALTSIGIMEDDLLVVTHDTGTVYAQIFAARHVDTVAGLFIIDGYTSQQFLKAETASSGFIYFVKGLLTPFWSFRNGGYYKAKLQEEVAAKPLTKHELASSELILGPSDIPVAVVSSSQMIKKFKNWSDNQRSLTDITKNNVLWSILDGPHAVWKNPESQRKLVKQIQDVVHYNLRK